MLRMRTIWLAVLLAFGVCLCASAQNGPQSQPGNTVPASAFGQNAPVLDPENPPVTGLDEPGLELRTATRSFISPALQVSESADTNGSNQFGNNSLESVTRVLGALDLQQFWAKSDLFLEYLGGGAFYSSPSDARQMQAAGLEAVTRWRTGQVTLRDSFSYLPDGSFQIGFGGTPGLGLTNGGFGGGGVPGIEHFGTGALGSVGDIPRLSNTVILDAVQAFTPRSAITVAGGFSNAHFYDPSPNPTLLNSDQITVQGGYSHLLNRHDQLGVIYAFQLFQFPQNTGGQVYNHVVNIRWSHTVTGRLSLIAGVGPQYTELEEGGYVKHWSASGRFQLRYKLGRASATATYEKFTSQGSGFFAGADTQVARLGYKRPVGRTWDFYGDVSYSHNKKLQNICPPTQPCGAQTASSYDDGSAGVVFRKHLGRTYDFFGSYRFSELAFNNPPGGQLNNAANGRIERRNTGTIGVEWHPAPTRIE